MSRHLPADHRIREEGEGWLTAQARRTNDALANWLGGATPEGKRSFGNLFMAVAAVAVALLGYSDGADWLGYVSLGSMLLAWLLFHRAGEQEKKEASARDLVEWGREAIAFRRAVGPLWELLKDYPYNQYAQAAKKVPAAPQPGPKTGFRDVVANAGWPDDRGRSAEILESYLREHLPPVGYESVVRAGGSSSYAFSSNREALIAAVEAAKDIVEIWHIALRVGGSRAPALRKVIRDLRDNHLNSIRLLWFLAIAHANYRDFAEEPHYEFVSDIRDVMVSTAVSGPR